jgi:hypothetical protein
MQPVCKSLEQLQFAIKAYLDSEPECYDYSDIYSLDEAKIYAADDLLDVAAICNSFGINLEELAGEVLNEYTK